MVDVHNTTPGTAIAARIKAFIVEHGAEYRPDPKTKCNLFLSAVMRLLSNGQRRDFEAKPGGNIPLAAEMVEIMRTSMLSTWQVVVDAHPALPSTPIQLSQASLDRAISLARNGLLVVAAHPPHDGEPGHVSIILPEPPQKSDKWNLTVPLIAQAGVDSSKDVAGCSYGNGVVYGIRLSCGFNATLKPGLIIYATTLP